MEELSLSQIRHFEQAPGEELGSVWESEELLELVKAYLSGLEMG